VAVLFTAASGCFYTTFTDSTHALQRKLTLSGSRCRDHPSHAWGPKHDCLLRGRTLA